MDFKKLGEIAIKFPNYQTQFMYDARKCKNRVFCIIKVYPSKEENNGNAPERVITDAT